MARLPLVEPENAPEPVREALESLRVRLNIFKMMANAETCFRPLLRLGSAILRRQQLDPKYRELAVLQAAKITPGEYEWVQHVPIAKAAGVSEAQIEALERDDIAANCFDPIERLVLRFNSDVLNRAEASDEIFGEMRAHFSPREIVELIITLGYYAMLSRLTQVTKTDLDAPAGVGIVESDDATAAREGR